MWAGHRLDPLWGSLSREYLQEDREETFVWWKDDTKVQKNDPN